MKKIHLQIKGTRIYVSAINGACHLTFTSAVEHALDFVTTTKANEFLPVLQDIANCELEVTESGSIV